MSASSNRARTSRHTFRPTAGADARLEERIVMSNAPVTLHEYLTISQRLLANPSPRLARVVGFPAFTKNAPGVHENPRTIYAPAIQTIRGGQAVNVVTTDGSRFRIQLGYVSNTQQTSANEGAAGAYAVGSGQTALSIAQPTETPQPQGTVRVYPRPDGSVGIIVDGSTSNTELTINPLPRSIRKGYAHSFAYGQAEQTRVLDVSSITVNSGSIASILGYHTANLTGPVTVSGSGAIDRIAFRSIGPGGAITTGGDVDTLDILAGATLSGGSISIGRDLNLLNVGGDLVLANGSNLFINRDLGLVPQPPKGTATGSNVLTLNVPLVGTQTTQQFPPVSGLIKGDVVINPGSQFAIGRGIDNQLQVNGSFTGLSHFSAKENNVPPDTTTTPPTPVPPIRILGTITA
ncbi:hypothetical protein [Planctomyces sp. SH-PL62]|uniref:hypothetical protein n=1 Tax=Planctomyces sp. SH-PL62 TaxID=1636152 RepID=UPI00078EF7B7|nr:hypothetical protein [Planctomyces sp. SH-PL62]AMV36465.1 hypothetical protein VT85_03470 [Planctomyces sp. SH-PL62]